MPIFTTRGGGDPKVMGTAGFGLSRCIFCTLESQIRHMIMELLTVDQNSAKQMIGEQKQAPFIVDSIY